MGRGSPVCQQIREKIIEMFKNNVPQRKIGRELDISNCLCDGPSGMDHHTVETCTVVR